MGLVFEPGQAEGAIPNGTVVEKCNSMPGDGHPDGARATVLSSQGPHAVAGFGPMYGYFVQWDDVPEIPVFIAGIRIRPVLDAKRN